MGPVLVLGNEHKEAVPGAVEEIRSRLESDFGIAGVDLRGDLDLAGAEADWVLVLGGDGAMLNAARRMAS
ncbi:MAG: NAD(+)/NADH kinase, partial [Planctomycetota bacterium]